MCKKYAKILAKFMTSCPCALEFSILSGLKCDFYLFFSQFSYFCHCVRKIDLV